MNTTSCSHGCAVNGIVLHVYSNNLGRRYTIESVSSHRSKRALEVFLPYWQSSLNIFYFRVAKWEGGRQDGGLLCQRIYLVKFL